MTVPRTVGWGIALATLTALISGISVFANGLIVKEFADPVVLTGARNAIVGAVLLAILLGTGGAREVRSLSGRVLEQNPEAAKLQPFTRHLNTQRANFQRIFLAAAPRAARMDHQVIGAQQNRALDFFTKRFD